MATHSGILRYLADCYRENGTRPGLTRLEAGRVRRWVLCEGEDAVVSPGVLDGLVFLRGPEARELARQAQLRRKDCELSYGSVFLAGEIETGEGRIQSCFAPLLLYPAEVTRLDGESGAEFSIEVGRRTLNHQLLATLGDEEFLGRLEEAVDRTGHTEACVGELRDLLVAQLPDLDVAGILDFPRLLGPAEFQAASRARRGGAAELRLIPAAVFLLADRSTEMRGVLNDLETMAVREGRLSAPVRLLLGAGEGARSQTPDRLRGCLPAILSEAQERVIASSRIRPLTLAVGPPGTGKTFTIAALAMEAMSRGETVLIASRMDHAVDVVADKIEEVLELPGLCVRGGRKSYLRDLIRFLDDLLAGLHDVPQNLAAERRAGRARWEEKERTLERLGAAWGRRFDRAVGAAELARLENPGLWRRWRLRRARRAVSREEPLHRLAARIDGLRESLVEEGRRYFQLDRRVRLAAALKRNRPSFQAFLRGLRARTSQRQAEYFQQVNWRPLLEALPVWLVNLSDLHRVLPLEEALFDLVILDEASQCDIASALPALERGRRAVIAGDPRQLRHLSFLSGAREAEFAARHGLDPAQRDRFHFRRNSLADLASESLTDHEAVVFLDEHFRSHPEIVAFSNGEFYGGRLKVMTTLRTPPGAGPPALSLEACQGQREAAGANPVEVTAVMDLLGELACSPGPPPSLGILSPFRDQVDAIQKALSSRDDLGKLLEEHRLLVGTAHSFQGEERDIMILSLTLDDRSPAASFRFLAQGEVFNVAITRARHRQVVLCSFDPNRDPGGLVSRYLAAIPGEGDTGLWPVHRENSPGDGSWAGLGEALQGRGFAVENGVAVGGGTIDLVARKSDQVIALELVGFPGAANREGRASMGQRLCLGRAGVALVPLSYLEWLERGEGILDELGLREIPASSPEGRPGKAEKPA